jgi:hypothetical protein
MGLSNNIQKMNMTSSAPPPAMKPTPVTAPSDVQKNVQKQEEIHTLYLCPEPSAPPTAPTSGVVQKILRIIMEILTKILRNF